MGNILYTKFGDNGPLNFFCGNVKSVTPPNAENRPYRVTMTLSLADQDTGKFSAKDVDMNAWNGERANRADRVARMKLHPGSYVVGICGDVTERQGKNRTFLNASLFNLHYSSSMTIEDGGKEYILLCGRIGNLRELKGGAASAGIVVDEYDREKQEPVLLWYNLDFDGDVAKRVAKTKKLVKGARMTILGQIVETEKETKNPVVKVLRFDFADPYKPRS